MPALSTILPYYFTDPCRKVLALSLSSCPRPLSIPSSSPTCSSHLRPLSKRSATNIKLTNVWMMLRKCCNHPYLLEFPMTSDGEFRIDEDLVSSCGKMMILDRLLPLLITRGHKVQFICVL